MLQTALAKLLTLKVGATALAVTATGGVALAAANGTLPNPLTEASAKPSAHATGAPKPKGEKSPGAKGTPSPSMVGLCRAYTAKAGDNPGKALENPAFTVLITTAGGREQVAAYCDTLLAAEKAKPSHRPSTTPSHPTGKPDGRPSPQETARTGGPGGGHQPSTPTAR
ncbi:hypothetical protein ABZ754_07035 [Micromonospora purpureochromogenes]|uniref:hypothetical protein n=1 Tax=Micromonospora purpureochromogenes TaxID=47872 RepID=UPI0033F6529D